MSPPLFQAISDLNKLIYIAIFWILLTFGYTLSFAQEKTSDDEGALQVNDNPPIIIIQSRLEEPLKDASGSVSVMTTPEIDAQNPITVPEVLRDLPGVQIQESGTIGEATVLTLRGSEPSQTLILLDGIRVNNPFRGNFYLGDFMIDAIGQIEIVRGTQSALYGSEAMGGVVNLKTRQAVRPLEISVRQEAGNESTFREVLSVSGRKQWIDGSLTISRTDSDGQFDNDRFGASTLSGYIGFPIREAGRIELTSRFQNDHKELATDLVPISATTVQAIFDPNNEFHQRFLFNSLQYQDKIFPWLGLSWKAAMVDTDLDWSNPIDPVNSNVYFENTDTRTLILDMQQNLYLDKSDTVVFGIEWKRDMVDSVINIFSSDFPVNQSRRNIAYFLQNLYKIEDQFVLQTGVRIDDNSSFETVVNPKVSTAYEFKTTKTKLRGSWGMGFRAPTIQEQFFPIFGNPEINPERSRSWEVGVQQKFPAQNISLDTAYYLVDYNNLIQKSPMGISNFGKARTQGVESALEIYLLQALTLRANYTYLDAKNRLTDQELPFRSRHRGNISLLYAPLVNFSMNLDVNVVSSQDISVADFILHDGTLRTNRNPGYVRVDLSGTYYQLGGFLGLYEARFFFKIRNLFDREYQDIPGFDAPGIGFVTGMMVIL